MSGRSDALMNLILVHLNSVVLNNKGASIGSIIKINRTIENLVNNMATNLYFDVEAIIRI